MSKKIIIFLGSLMVIACAGNPPAWWNPTGKDYSAIEQSPVRRPVFMPDKLANTAEELDIALQDEAYEEMTLTPLQDEEGENESGDSSAQSVVPEEDESFLPPPSILEE